MEFSHIFLCCCMAEVEKHKQGEENGKKNERSLHFKREKETEIWFGMRRLCDEFHYIYSEALEVMS